MEKFESVWNFEDDFVTWRELLTKQCERYGDKIENLTIVIADGELDRKFDGGYGCAKGAPFTAWSDTRVYFPCEYDGSERVASVSRHPDGKVTEHI